MPTQGPLSTSRDGLSLFMKTYLSYQPWIKDDYLVPIPWRSVELPPRLKIAVMWSDGIVTPHPPVVRALKEVAKYLTDAGIEVVDWKPEGHDECWDIAQALYFEDGGKNMENLILRGGEKLLPLTTWLVKDNKNVKYRTAEDVCGVSWPVFSHFSKMTKAYNSFHFRVAQSQTEHVPPQIQQTLAQDRQGG